MDASQVTGASSSYARKYALNGLFAIDDNKDSDATNQGDKSPVSASNVKTGKDAAGNGERDSGQPVAAPDGIYYCSDCGNEIVGIKMGSRVMKPHDIAYSTLSNYGRQLCKDCAQKAKNESKTA